MRSRASAAASAALGRNVVPGVDTDRIAVATSSSAIVSNDASGLQSGSAATTGLVNPGFLQQVSVEGRDGVVVGVDS